MRVYAHFTACRHHPPFHNLWSESPHSYLSLSLTQAALIETQLHFLLFPFELFLSSVTRSAKRRGVSTDIVIQTLKGLLDVQIGSGDQYSRAPPDLVNPRGPNRQTDHSLPLPTNDTPQECGCPHPRGSTNAPYGHTIQWQWCSHRGRRQRS